MKSIKFTFKRLIWISLLCLGLILFPVVSHALNVQDVPNPRQINNGWVTDMANILSDSTESQLNQMISGLEATNGTELAVVTVPETTPAASPKSFATELFNHWGIGKVGEDNGVLFLISVSDRRVEIETGYGVEPILPDAQVGNIIQNEITPKFKQGDFDGGVLAGTTALLSVLRGESYEYSPKSDSAIPFLRMSGQERGLILLLGGVAAVLSTIGYRKAYRMSKRSIFLFLGKRSRVERNELYRTRAYFVSFSASFILILLAVTIIPTPLAYIEGGQAIIAIITAVFAGLIVSFPITNWLMQWFRSLETLCCAHCHLPMKQVNLSLVSSHLTAPEKVAEKLCSVRFEAWHCSSCEHKKGRGEVHIRAYVVDSKRFRQCHICHELTVTRTQETVIYPTEYSTGIGLIIDHCHCCDYHREKEEIIPCLPPPSSSSSSNSSYTSSSSNSDSSSSSSSDFGGGDSGGGGAGGDW